jgi:hypothetical protein
MITNGDIECEGSDAQIGSASPDEYFVACSSHLKKALPPPWST